MTTTATFSRLLTDVNFVSLPEAPFGRFEMNEITSCIASKDPLAPAVFQVLQIEAQKASNFLAVCKVCGWQRAASLSMLISHYKDSECKAVLVKGSAQADLIDASRGSSCKGVESRVQQREAKSKA
jgi:hypothetical protein